MKDLKMYLTICLSLPFRENAIFLPHYHSLSFLNCFCTCPCANTSVSHSALSQPPCFNIPICFSWIRLTSLLSDTISYILIFFHRAKHNFGHLNILNRCVFCDDCFGQSWSLTLEVVNFVERGNEDTKGLDDAISHPALLGLQTQSQLCNTFTQNLCCISLLFQFREQACWNLLHVCVLSIPLCPTGVCYPRNICKITIQMMFSS